MLVLHGKSMNDFCAQLVRFIVLIAVFSLSVPSANARGPKKDERTPDQKAQAEEAALKATELKIGLDCLPKSWATQLDLKTRSAAGVKHFWLGQRYAVARKYQQDVAAYRLYLINNAADARIASIEEQRTNASLAALGVAPMPGNPEVDRIGKEADQFLNSQYREILASSQQWATKCYRYADDLSK